MYGAKVCVRVRVTCHGDNVEIDFTFITQNQQVIHRVTHTCA